MEMTKEKRNQLFSSHIKLANKIAFKFSKRLSRRDLELKDIDQEAYIALWNAARDFKPELKIMFSTFAYHAVKNHLIKFFQKKTLPTVPFEPGVHEGSYDQNYSQSILVNQIKKAAYNSLGERSLYCFLIPLRDETFKECAQANGWHTSTPEKIQKEAVHKVQQYLKTGT
jgi:RNA polymerase sigma factor (sigma-70 family)